MYKQKDELYFNAKQFALVLEYVNTKQAIKTNVDENDKIQLCNIENYSQIYSEHLHILFLTEEGLRSLIILSKTGKAKPLKPG